MKKSNLVLIVFMVVLAVVGWVAYFSQFGAAAQERNTLLSQAAQYSEKSLHQKAIACYDEVLAKKESKDTRDLWLESYKNAYTDKAVALSDYTNALNQMCVLYPQESIYWETLIGLYLENGGLTTAYETYNKCNKAGAVNETIADYGKTILYTCNLKGKTYFDYACNAGGYYTVFDGDEWGVLDRAGETVYDCEYEYISPYSDSYIALYVTEAGQRVKDWGRVIEAKVDITFSKTGGYADGILPVCEKEGVWKYLNCATNSYLNGTYEKASNFANGTAAVCKDNKWTLINVDGETVCDVTFSDVKLHTNGDYLYGGVMVAAVNGEYGLYNAKGETIANVKAKDMDFYEGGDVAFKDNSGKWGFVNKEGKETVKPQFAEAKSFSNGLAAVSNGEKWGFIDTDGEVVIAHQYVGAGHFTREGTCMVSLVEGQYNILKRKFF